MRKNRNDAEGAQVPLIKEIWKKLAEKHSEFKIFEEDWQYKRDPQDTIEVPVRKFSLEALRTLYGIYKGRGSAMGDRWNMGQIAAHIKVIKTGGDAKIEQLRSLESAIYAWVKKEIVMGWVFRRVEETGIMQAMQVTSVRYHPAVSEQGYKHPAYVSLHMTYWDRGSIKHPAESFYAADVIGKTVTDILGAEGIYHETEELVEQYEKDEKLFMEWRELLGEQFVGTGEFEGLESEDEDRRHRRKRSADAKMHGIRLVMDDECKAIENRQVSDLFSRVVDDDEDDHDEEESDDKSAREENEDKADHYSRLPLAHYVRVFNLSSYNFGEVHCGSIKPYVYRPELREKLILSEEHAELIDTLTADMDVLMEDVISGKSGGTAILCQGVAGTGKTLTAEIYSEVIKRPLYRVHSGQLGTSAGSVEEELKKALENAMRWRAVLLIDEADVFISARGNDLEKNAVIGVFLRVLEYYNGLLFLTTNRVDIIDEAILSRTIAVIKFEVPQIAEREKLWTILSDVFGLKVVDKKLAKELAATFECTGRDIKGLVKLVTKFQRQRGKQATLADFKRLASFKGLNVAKGK